LLQFVTTISYNNFYIDLLQQFLQQYVTTIS